LYCLNLNLDPKKHKPNVDFKEKCLKAIDIIDFQINNTAISNNINKPENLVLIESEENTTNKSETKVKNKEFTTRRQVLAMYYIFNELDKGTNSIDKTLST